MAKAAYRLAPEEELHIGQTTINGATVHGDGNNYVKAYADEAWARVNAANSGWGVLKGGAGGINLGATGSTGILNMDPWFFEGDGIYHCENAAAFAVRCGDAVVISFRGTNDNDGGVPFLDKWNPVTGFINPTTEEANWVDMAGHYAELKPFVDAVDAYVASQNLQKVYVTGHSLGGGMALGYMDKHAPNSRTTQNGSVINYEAITFAAPGYLVSSVLDTRAICIEID